MKLEIYNKPFSFTQVYFEMWVDFTLQSIMELITALIKTAWVGLAWKLFYKATVEHFYALLWLPVVELTLVHVTSWQSRSILCVTSQFFGASTMLHVFGGLKSLVNLSQQVHFQKLFPCGFFDASMIVYHVLSAPCARKSLKLGYRISLMLQRLLRIN